MQKSPEWQGSHFENPQPIVNKMWAAIVSLSRSDPNVKPQSPPSTVPVEPGRFAAPPPSGLRVTWLGHSTVLLEIDGHRFLTDPVWSERVGPTDFAGPKRWFPPLLALRDLPLLDGVVLSHDHYDHLDYATIVALKNRNITFVAPLGVGAHLERWGVPAAQIVELDWWDSRAFGDRLFGRCRRDTPRDACCSMTGRSCGRAMRSWALAIGSTTPGIRDSFRICERLARGSARSTSR
jgi:hypothetical protein